MRVVKDEHRCMASGYCCSAVPEIFQLRDGDMVILEPQPDAALWEGVREAVANCPSEALSIVED
jgi:ferredoxin